MSWQEDSTTAEHDEATSSSDYITRIVMEKLGETEAVADTAISIYRDSQHIDFYSNEDLEEACIGIALAKHGVPYPASKIAYGAEITRKKLQIHAETEYSQELIKPTECLHLAHDIVNKGTLSTAKEVIDSTPEKHYSSSTPFNIAAAAVYIGCLFTGESVSQRTISDIFGCSKVTVRDRYQELLTVSGVDIEPDQVNSLPTGELRRQLGTEISINSVD